MQIAPPVLTPTQRAWLQEIGIDARMLAHFSTEAFAGQPADPPARAAPVQPSPGDPPARVASAAPSVRAPVEPRLRAAPAGPQPGSQAQVYQPPAVLPADTSLAALREHVAACTACALNEVRSRTVFGEGVEQTPRWMFIGEAPGEYDESAGRPFQGRAGELLRAMLGSVGLDAAPVYFTNVLKCRPMGNRSPEPAEIAACLPLLRRQITLLRPGCLVALGRVSAAALLGREGELDELRGSVHDYLDDDGRRIPLVVTHHPAALLLHGQYKAEAWRDLNVLRQLGA